MSTPFLHSDNKAVLQRVLYKDICRRYGGDLNEKQASRLMKTVDYYVTEVHRVHGNKNIQFLNTEVLGVVLPDYMAYLERSERSVTRSAVSDIEEGPAQQPQEPRREIQDIDNAFSALQTQRQEVKVRPVMKDFHISLSEEPPLSMEVFERMKQEREGTLPSQALTTFVEASDSFLHGTKKAQEETEFMFAEQERKKLEKRASIPLPVPPDLRSIYEKPLNTSAANPTVIERSTLAHLPQAILTKERDVMAYRETETNLFLYSGDRDWISNTTETRYNFTTVFDPAGLPGATPYYHMPTVPTRFRNIVRIEFIKAIIPGEGLDPLITKSTSTAYTANANMNALSFPYIQVRIPELETNSFGTNQGITTSFALIQYDANWINDSSLGAQRGYLAMIPKFMKCQKVYTTPLSTLQRLSIQMQRPDGTLLSTALDTLDVDTVYPSIAINSTVLSGGPAAIANTIYQRDSAVDVSGSSYYWIRTKNYFSVSSFTTGDRVLLKNIAWSSWTPLSPSGDQLSQLNAIVAFLQRASGHIIISVGSVTGTGLSSVFSDTPRQGYANAFLVRGDFPDPNATATLGIFTPNAPSGIADDPTVAGSPSLYLLTNPATSGRVLNQSRQVHVAFRVITREFDSTGIIRSDNL